MSAKVSRKVQMGREGTAGTPVAASTIHRGIGLGIKDLSTKNLKFYSPKRLENLGMLSLWFWTD